MLIRSIRAENFMRFSSLRLADLPLRGIIGIEGPNESGKTTIGEAILFAFFGKTRKSSETSVARLIRWDAEFLSVEVEFSIPGRGDFLIFRQIDKAGTNFVKLVDSTTREELAAGNVQVARYFHELLRFDFSDFLQSFYLDQHQDGLSGDFGAGFLERMTGIAHIQEAVRGLRREIEQLEREYAHYQKDVQRNLQQMDKYDSSATRLGELRESSRRVAGEIDGIEKRERAIADDLAALRRIGEEHGKAGSLLDDLGAKPAAEIRKATRELGERCRAIHNRAQGVEKSFYDRCQEAIRAQGALLDQLDAMLEEYQQLRSHFQDLSGEIDSSLSPESEDGLRSEQRAVEAELARGKKSCRRLAILSALLGAAAGILLGAAAAIAAEFPPGPQLVEAFGGLGIGKPAAQVAGAVAGGTVLVLLLAGLGRRLALGGKVRRLAEELARIDRRIRDAEAEREELRALISITGSGEVGRFVQAAEKVADPVRRGRLLDFSARFGPFLEADGAKEYRKALRDLARGERDLRSRALKEVQRQEATAHEAASEKKKLLSERDRVDSEIRECEAQAPKRASLAAKNDELEARSRSVFGEMETRRAAVALLEETAGSIRGQIGPSISKLVRKVFPRLTRNRYRDLRVENDLAVKLFTSEKSDFLDLAELSGGTLEGLRLALRLAFSQAFLLAHTRRLQFAFLDEPFKMMDSERACETLRVLRDLSPDIQQLFVIQPNFTPEQRSLFDRTIRTRLDSSELVFEAGGSPGAAGTLVPDATSPS